MKNLAILILITAFSCTSPVPTAQEVVDEVLKAHGTALLENASASFTFRFIEYTYSMQNGQYAYSRIQRDTLGNEVRDVLTNDGLIRYINNEPAEITNEKRAAYSSSVNSVIYFALLPFHLNDQAVIKEYKGIVEIKGRSYNRVKVTFNQEGGGEDYEDVFYYWFDIEDSSMDYLAYSYNEDDGKGIRFRVAYNSRVINGVTIQDYKNLKPVNEKEITETSNYQSYLDNIDQAYQNQELQELSLIELEKVKIKVN